jgi:hypothetical protein
MVFPGNQTARELTMMAKVANLTSPAGSTRDATAPANSL